MYGNRNFGGQGGGFSPVKVGDELDVKVEAVGKQGDGIAKEKGFVLFVPGAKEGDEIRIRVTKVLRNVGFAEMIGQASGPVEQQKDEPQEEQTEEESSGEPQSEDEGAEESKDTEEDSSGESQDSEDFGEELEEKQE